MDLIGRPTTETDVQLETVACDLCGQHETVPVYQVKDTNYGTPGEFVLVQCCQCGLAYLSPRPLSSDLSKAYPEDTYDPFRNIHATDNVAPYPMQRDRARWLTKLISTGKVLDVGCADGLFLSAMRDTGWVGVGVEPSVGAATFAQTHLQLDVRLGDIFAVAEKQSFDLITLWDVLEHTPSPTQVLKYAAQLLKPQGWLVLSLPNWNSLERRLFRERWIALDAPRHLYHFSDATIRRMLTACGFMPHRIEARAPVLSLASNVLRFAGDHWYRRGQPQALVKTDSPTRIVDKPSVAKQRVIQLTHLLMTPPNAVVNLMQRGASLTVLARLSGSI